jgi:CheY-like chemotaxis protein
MNSFKVLIVDDQIENIKSIVSILENNFSNAILYQANSGKSAMNVINKAIPDIILTDWEMPEMSGLDLVSLLQNDNKLRMIPVLMVTGIMVTKESLKSAFDAGVVDFLTKPVSAVELISRMQSALRIVERNNEILKSKERVIVNQMIQNNDLMSFIKGIHKEIEHIIERTTPELFDSLCEKIHNKLDNDNINLFKHSYDEVYPDFTKNLLNMFPDLTPKEIKLASLIRLGLSVKELAEIMCVTPDSMKVFRSRLRKKMNLKPEQGFKSFLDRI